MPLFLFFSKSKFIDVTPPFLSGLSPAPGSTVAKDTNIFFTIDDTESGVALSTVQFTIDGYVAVSNGVIQDGYTGSITISSSGKGYDVLLNPTNNFPYDGYITVFIDAQDLQTNALSSSWSFNIAPLFAFPSGSYNEAFEFADGWDETVASIPSPSFALVDHNEAFEFADGWDETVASIPSPSFSSANLDENYDSGWDGT